PDLTPLESWGDYSPREGVWGLMQPAMGPVPVVGERRQDGLDLVMARSPQVFPGVETKATGDLLLAPGRVLGPGSHKGPFRARNFTEHLREAWQAVGKSVAPGVPFDQFWEEALRRGGVFTEVPVAKVQLSAALRLGRAHEALEGPGE